MKTNPSLGTIDFDVHDDKNELERANQGPQQICWYDVFNQSSTVGFKGVSCLFFLQLTGSLMFLGSFLF